MKNWKLNIFLLFLSMLSTGCLATKTALYYSAPSLLPNTSLSMKTPGFWISQHPDPDRMIMSADEIQQFNRTIREGLKLTHNVFDQNELKGDELRLELSKTIEGIKRNHFYTSENVWAGTSFFRKIQEQINTNAIQNVIIPKFGITVNYANERILPTEKGLYGQPGDIDFDELQNTTFDIGTPVVILHESLDGVWYYVHTPTLPGWIKKEDIALGTQKLIQDYVSNKQFVVVKSAKADIYREDKMLSVNGFAQMGTKFPVFSENAEAWQVNVPKRNADGQLSFYSGFISKEEAVRGYLKYTPRTIIYQAFKMLNAPYGWGGMYGEQDCSRFIQMIFATVGIELPRNSSEQAQVGNLLADLKIIKKLSDKQDAIARTAIGGISVLTLKGHILLYLGNVNGKPYAIHEAWGYRETSRQGADRIRVVNRVIVSDLLLGESSRKGSLLDRLTTIRSFSP